MSTAAPGSSVGTGLAGPPARPSASLGTALRGAGARRRAAFGALVLAVALLHVLLLGGWRFGRGDAPARGGVAAMLVRQIVAPATNAANASRDNAPPQAPPAPAVAPQPKPRAEVAKRAPAASAAPASSATPPDAAALAAAAAPAAPAPDNGATPPPRYGTRVPPAATLSYELRRSAGAGNRASGPAAAVGSEGELTWRVEDDHYQLELRGGTGAREAIGWTSRGRIDDSGVAPERFVARRRGRDQLAVNFRRDDAAGGRITFSGPTTELPLLPGVQDRVSWMLQLGAILEADPTLGSEGSSVSMWVVGPRGDAEVWTFVVKGRAGVDLPERRVEDAVFLVREPNRPYDTRVEVWLDPVRHHLPVRVRLEARQNGQGGESTEFLLRALQTQ